MKSTWRGQAVPSSCPAIRRKTSVTCLRLTSSWGLLDRPGGERQHDVMQPDDGQGAPLRTGPLVRPHRTVRRLPGIQSVPNPEHADALGMGRSCGHTVDSRLVCSAQNGQLPGLGASIRSVAPGGAKYVTMFCAAVAVSLRAMCAWSPTSRNPWPAVRTTGVHFGSSDS